MHTQQNSSEGFAMDGFDFRKAKVEHYLERAQEFIEMGRLLAAKRPLETVFTLDPSNGLGRSMQKSVEHSLAYISKKSSRLSDGPGLEETMRRQRRPELIMIVDQDEKLLFALSASLRKYGYKVVSAGNYKEALDLLSFVSPNIVISEVNFENGPMGFDLYLWVRTNSRLQEIPFLFLATKVDREMLIAGKRLGVNDFILKPLDEDVVYASIVSCFKRQQRLAPTIDMHR
ncbi:MAG: PleD family two-component system response regulator [Bacteroidota bacterium]